MGTFHVIGKISVLIASFLITTCVEASKDSYALNTGEAGAKRLDVQSQYMHKESCEHLARAGLKDGQVVSDIACGNGYMTLYMATVVGPSGHVYAVDVSAAQLDLAKKRIHDAGLTNVTFIQANILDDTNIPIPPMDLVYSRLLLMHLTNPGKAIGNMLGLLKTNGTIALHEPITSTCHVEGYPNQLQEFVKTILDLGNHLGLDYDIGLRLKSLAEAQGLKNVSQTEHQYQFSPDFARDLLTMTLKDWGPRAIKEKVMSEDKYTALAQDLQQLKKPFWISKAIYITGVKL